MSKHTKHILVLLFLYSTISWAQKIIPPRNIDVVIKNDTVYNRGESMPYTGYYKEYYVGPIKAEGNYMNGLKNGEFKYHSQNNDLEFDSIVNYKLGKKNGISKTFTYWNYLATLKNYVNDTLDGYCYTWFDYGQLELIDIYKKGQLMQEIECPINYNIERISCDIKGLENSKLTRTFIKSHDTLEIIIVGNYTPDNKWDTSYFIKLDDYKIVSFSYIICTGPGDVEECWEGASQIIITGLYSKPSNHGNLFSILDLDDLFRLELYNILIENHCGIQYMIPSINMRIY